MAMIAKLRRRVCSHQRLTENVGGPGKSRRCLVEGLEGFGEARPLSQLRIVRVSGLLDLACRDVLAFGNMKLPMQSAGVLYCPGDPLVLDVTTACVSGVSHTPYRSPHPGRSCERP